MGDKMQSIYDNRAMHLRELRKKCNTNRELSEVIEVKEQVIGQLLKGETGKKIGTALARRIEEKFDLPQNALDQSHFSLEQEAPDNETLEIARKLKELGVNPEKLVKLVELLKN
ncbi:hypothetical protein P3TCK_17457 [Photobacterium profundum 3TCK]|uniref:Uncharacterized protein n=2 Tax=Photobacterium profundum TaxID=74109 RepID=Q1YW31_9GAMM|nr:hypothetical protein P3TCK_17457 [Photobacterium profundum 3TCK]